MFLSSVAFGGVWAERERAKMRSVMSIRAVFFMGRILASIC